MATLGKYKVHGSYGPLYEIVTAGRETESDFFKFIRCILNELVHETESEVELYFFADNKMARRKKRVNPDLERRRNTQGTESIS